MFGTVGINGSTGSTNLSVREESLDQFTYYFQTVFCGTLVLPTVVLNTLVTAVLLKDRRSSPTTGFNTFTIALALTDLLVGAVMLPLHLYQALLQQLPYGAFGCAIWQIVDYGLTSVSVFLMVAMGADRSKCVTSPLVYRMEFTKKRAVIISVTLWILGFAVWVPIILVAFFRDGYAGQTILCNLSNVGEFIIVQIVVAYIIPILAMVVVYARLILTVRKRSMSNLSDVSSFSSEARRKGHGMKKRNTDRTGNKITVKSGLHSVEKRRRSSSINCQNRQCVKVSVFIVLSFLVCWSPFCILKPVDVLDGKLIPANVFFVFSFLTYLNSAITPLIYVVTSGKVRNGMRDLLFRRKPSRHVQVYSIEETGLDDVSENHWKGGDR